MFWEKPIWKSELSHPRTREIVQQLSKEPFKLLNVLNQIRMFIYAAENESCESCQSLTGGKAARGTA